MATSTYSVGSKPLVSRPISVFGGRVNVTEATAKARAAFQFGTHGTVSTRNPHLALWNPGKNINTWG